MVETVAGIDVGKWRLDVSVAQGPVQGFDNTAEGIAALLGWVTSEGASEAVCEPTGGYEREVVRQLRESGLPVHVAHPNKVRNFARAAGHEAKTDVLDAASALALRGGVPTGWPAARRWRGPGVEGTAGWPYSCSAP